MNRIFFYPTTACDQFQDATNVTADVLYIRSRESILDITSNEFLLTQAHDLKRFALSSRWAHLNWPMRSGDW